ncbi:hypothetical protein BC833DRAFT_527678, partial [Globomyces pollinis-pini]
VTLHFVKLVLGNKNYKEQVSTDGCSNVAAFRGAIKSKFSPDLDSYAPHHLTLFQPDGTSQIDPETPVTDLKEIPWKPMVVTVEELPIPVPIGSSKKQLTYKGLGVEASCRNYFDALAAKLALFYKFDWGVDSSFPTIGDTLAERTNEVGYVEPPTKVPKLPIPLPELFDQNEWKKIKELNRKTTDRIHDTTLPKEKGKFFIILPTAEFNDETVRFFKRIGVKGKLFAYEEDLIVKDEAELSGSGSEASSSLMYA